MSNNITKTIMESMESYEEKFNVFGECNPPHCHNIRFGGNFVDIGNHLLQSQIKVIEAVIEGMKQNKKDGKHRFDVGFQTCRYCGEPRFLFDIVRSVLKRDEKSGGELVEVTEKRYDQREFPCSKNPMPAYNQALEDQISSLNETLEFLKKSL